MVNFFKKVLALSQNISSQCLSSLDFKKPWSSHKYAQTLLACVSFFPHGHLSTFRMGIYLLFAPGFHFCLPPPLRAFPLHHQQLLAPPAAVVHTKSGPRHGAWLILTAVVHSRSGPRHEAWFTLTSSTPYTVGNREQYCYPCVVGNLA